MTAEFFRRYIDIVREAEDDMFASRQHQQIAHVFDRLAKDQFQFAEEEREEDDDPEAGNGYENDGESYLEVAAAFRRGLQPGLKTWWYLDTMLTENSAEEVEDALGINLYDLKEQLKESDDDAFGTRTLPLPPLAGKRGAIAREFIGLARGMIQSAQEHEAEDGNDHGCRSDAADYENVARAFAKSMEAGIDAWEGLDTLLQEDSADAIEAETDIDLYELRDKAHERWAKTPAGQAAAAERARRDAEWEAEWEADAPARAANEVKMWVVEKGKNKPQLPEVEYDQREHPNFQKELAEFQELVNDSSWRNKPYEIKVTIGGKPVKV